MAQIINSKENFLIEFHFYEDGVFLTKSTDNGEVAPPNRICSIIDECGSLYKSHFGNSCKRLYFMYK